MKSQKQDRNFSIQRYKRVVDIKQMHKRLQSCQKTQVASLVVRIGLLVALAAWLAFRKKKVK